LEELKDQAEDKWDELSEKAKVAAAEAKTKFNELKEQGEDKWEKLTGEDDNKTTPTA